MKREKNWGKELKKTMIAKGVSKIHIVKLLKTTRPTLNKRLIDGNFQHFEKAILIKQGLLPNDAITEF